MHNIKSKLKFLFLGDLLVLILVFGIFNYNKFSQIIPENEYLILLFTFIFFWVIFSIYYDKYRIVIIKPYWLAIRIISWSTLMCFLTITITVSFTDLWSTSRIFILLVTAVVFLTEIIFAAIISIVQPTIDIEKVKIQNNDAENLNNQYFFKWMIPGVILLIIIYISIIWIVEGNFIYNPFNEQSLLIIIMAWGISTLITNRYKAPNTLNHYYEIAPYIKAAIMTFFFLGFFYFFLRLDPYAANLMFKTNFVFSSLEVFGFYLYFFSQSKINGNYRLKDSSSPNHTNGQKNLIADKFDSQNNIHWSIQDLIQSLNDIHIINRSKILKLISDSLKNEKISRDKVSILNTLSTDNIQVLPNQSQDLLINFHDINDFRYLNYYLLATYKKLKNGGLIIGSFIPLEKFRENLRSKMPHFLFAIIFPIHFIFHRVFPKIPITKQLYFIITKGKNRIFSKAEIFGRLSFCGFEMVNNEMIGERIYFICKKLKTISLEESPSYGPIVKLKRIGYQGNIIPIYKFRTMHPYSEFIQGDIYEKYHLDKSGKLRNDYRITSWGKILRKYFIDELPQLYNWLRGDLKLIGVRALSEHYYSLYPKDLQELRINFKPGLIPPYYADLPKSFNQIISSERKYLKLKNKNSFFTDLKYLIQAIYNIVFSGARSN
ncbi:MAG: hypothetical protein CMG74_06045 [Candidatus Marinimicrobia bacterium]|nr:hypothetical protein [Candidatus Neomarinimicrobiota bacterium]